MSRLPVLLALTVVPTLFACSGGAETAAAGPTRSGIMITGAGGSSATGGAGGHGGTGAVASSSNAASSASSGAGGSKSDGGMLDGGPIGGDRPVTVHVPPTYTQGTPVPLVMMLHGYSATGALEEVYLNITAESDKRGFLYVYPDGTVDKEGLHFWNATDACCNLNGSTVDDSAYLSGVLADIQTRFSVDPKRVFVVGHSNGGFMSYRMACDHADQIAAIASLAGAMWEDVSRCTPANPVSVLEIHGTLDTVIGYNGGTIPGQNAYPSAEATVSDWVKFDGCNPKPDVSAPNLDLDAILLGAETTVTRYEAGCQAGRAADLWSIQGGSHLPTLTANFVPSMIDFLYAHPKP